MEYIITALVTFLAFLRTLELLGVINPGATTPAMPRLRRRSRFDDAIHMRNLHDPTTFTLWDTIYNHND